MGLDEGDCTGAVPENLAEAALNKVAELIAELQPGSMVQSFCLVVEVIDEEDRWISMFSAPRQKAWQSIGLLEYARDMDRPQYMGLVFPNTDDDEE